MLSGLTCVPVYLIFCAHSHSGPTQWAWAVLTLARVCKFLWLPKSLPLRGEQPDQPRPTAPVLLLTAELFPRAHADGIEVPIPMQQKVAPNTWPSL